MKSLTCMAFKRWSVLALAALVVSCSAEPLSENSEENSGAENSQTTTELTISITSPIEGAQFQVGQPIEFSAIASSSTASISLVEFFANETLLGTDDEAPFSLSWPDAPVGGHILTARAVDENADNVTSEGVQIEVIPVDEGPVQTPFGGTAWPIPGTIQAENFDEGGPDVAYFDITSENQGGAYRTEEHVDIQESSLGGYNVGWIQEGEWLEYTVDVQADGLYDFHFQVASLPGGRNFQVEFDGQDKTGPLTVPVTGDWQAWTTVSARAVSLQAGEQVMRISMLDDDFNLHSVEIVEADLTPRETGRYVLAHWMVRMGRHDANQRAQDDYEVVLEEMASFGIDALVIYWDSFVEAEEQYEMALAAAEATGVSVVIGTLGYNNEIIPFIIENADHPGLFRDDEDRLVISGYHNAWGLYQDGNTFPYDPDPDYHQLQILTDAGINHAYWPDMPYHPTQTDCERAAALGAVGVFDFKYGGNIGLGGGVTTYREWLDSADAHLADCNAHGIGTMPPILPFYAAQPSHNHMMFESFAYVGFREQWMWAIENEVEAVQLVTVNDYNEHTYLQTFGEGGPIVGHADNPFWAGNIVLDHSGFGLFMRRYAQWFRTGVEPPITEDEFLIAYRLHPRTAESWSDLSPEVQASLEHWLPPNSYHADYGASQIQRLDTHRVMEDSVQLVARLTETATITLTAGASTVTETLGPGEHILIILGNSVESTPGGDKPTFTPDQFGYPNVTVVRNGTTIMDVDAPLEITEYIAPGKFNYYAAELRP